MLGEGRPFALELQGVKRALNEAEIATLQTIDDPDVRAAFAAYRATDAVRFQFQSPTSGDELIASFASFPGGFGQPWEVVTLTPVDDFVGTLKATNRLIMIVQFATGATRRRWKIPFSRSRASVLA